MKTGTGAAAEFQRLGEPGGYAAATEGGDWRQSIAILGIVKRRRRPTAWFSLLAVVFAQFAMAGYACPLIEEALNGPVAKVEATTPCAEMGMASSEAISALCLEHCKVGQQLVDNHSPVSPLAVAAVVLFVVQIPMADVAGAIRTADPPAFRATAPPVFASSSRLRI